MEKFSRQALSSGVSEPESLEVTRESELFRALNLHYNKSNEYRVRNYISFYFSPSILGKGTGVVVREGLVSKRVT